MEDGRKVSSIYDRQHLYTVYLHPKLEFALYAGYSKGSIFHDKIVSNTREVRSSHLNPFGKRLGLHDQDMQGTLSDLKPAEEEKET